MLDNSKTKIAVILANLGGPDSLGSVRPFLFNLFYDRAIIDLPNPWRFLLAHWISFFRNQFLSNLILFDRLNVNYYYHYYYSNP
jgi:ferrochelatase